MERAREAREARDLAKHGRDAIWEALFPSLASPGDPPIAKGRQPTIAAPGDPDPRGIMFTVERLSGSGLPGSRLCVARGYYDGLGPRGGPAYDYVKLYSEFDGPGGYRVRSTAVAVRASELRQVAAVFLERAERLDAAGGGP